MATAGEALASSMGLGSQALEPQLHFGVEIISGLTDWGWWCEPLEWRCVQVRSSITEIGEENFKLAEVDLKQIFTVRYDEIKKLYRDYSHKDPFFGRNPKRNTILLVSIMTFLTVCVAAALVHPD
jgi:hypothetical protein